jgi:mono/diheme cytochrome c family protein
MRELWARNIAFLTGVLVVMLAIMFAMIQNPSEPPRSTVGEAVTKQPPMDLQFEADTEKQALITAGRKVFETKNCMGCHSIAGEGNPRYPLDGVGERRSAEAIRQWILAPTELKNQLPAGVFLVKQAYRNLSLQDVDALVAYLRSV